MKYCFIQYKQTVKYRITGIIRRRKVLQIAFFAVVCEKTFAIQVISYIKIPAEIKSARKHLRMLPDLQNSRNFSSTDDSCYTVASVGTYAYVLAYMKFCIYLFMFIDLVIGAFRSQQVFMLRYGIVHVYINQ